MKDLVFVGKRESSSTFLWVWEWQVWGVKDLWHAGRVSSKAFRLPSRLQALTDPGLASSLQRLMVPTPAQICMYHFLSFAPDGIKDHPLVKIILNVYLSIKNEYACVIKLRE